MKVPTTTALKAAVWLLNILYLYRIFFAKPVEMTQFQGQVKLLRNPKASFLKQNM